MRNYYYFNCLCVCLSTSLGYKFLEGKAFVLFNGPTMCLSLAHSRPIITKHYGGMTKRSKAVLLKTQELHLST